MKRDSSLGWIINSVLLLKIGMNLTIVPLVGLC